ncbi:hypothetical protein BH18ACI2_BH18ACI2_10970 [soil metagenome]
MVGIVTSTMLPFHLLVLKVRLKGLVLCGQSCGRICIIRGMLASVRMQLFPTLHESFRVEKY